MTRPYLNINDKWYASRKQSEHTHHILAKESWGSEDKNNKIKLFSSVHLGRHAFAWTEKIRESIIQVLEIHKTALNKEFIEDMFKILEEENVDYYYKNGIYCPKKDKSKLEANSRLPKIL